MSNEDLCALILPWAKAHEPKGYEKTLAVATRPPTFRRYLVRLVEIRAERERQFLREIPLSILEESAVRCKLKHRATGTTIEVAGQRAQGSRSWAFAELEGKTIEDLLELNELKTGLDLELVSIQRSNNATDH